MNHSLILPARVIARNRANANAMALYDLLSKVFAPFVGQKIEKVDGSLLAKVQASFPKITFFFYRYRSNYSVCYVAKECQSLSDGNSCVYEETTVYIGDVRDGVLQSLYPRPSFRHDWTVEEVQKLRHEAEEAEKIASDAKSKLCEFGMYDR